MVVLCFGFLGFFGFNEREVWFFKDVDLFLDVGVSVLRF